MRQLCFNNYYVKSYLSLTWQFFLLSALKHLTCLTNNLPANSNPPHFISFSPSPPAGCPGRDLPAFAGDPRPHEQRLHGPNGRQLPRSPWRWPVWLDGRESARAVGREPTGTAGHQPTWHAERQPPDADAVSPRGAQRLARPLGHQRTQQPRILPTSTHVSFFRWSVECVMCVLQLHTACSYIIMTWWLVELHNVVKKKKNHMTIILTYCDWNDSWICDICWSQTFFLTSGSKDLLARASLQHYSISWWCCFLTHFCSFKDLDIALGHSVISITFKYILKPCCWGFIIYCFNWKIELIGAFLII